MLHQEVVLMSMVGLLLETMFSSVICITNEGYFDVHVADGDHVEVHGLCCT